MAVEIRPKKRSQKDIIFKIVIPLILAVLLAISVIIAFSQGNKALAVQNQLNSVYQNSFQEIVGYMSNINTDLDKLMVVTNPQQYASILNEIWSKSSQVQALLGQIPITHSVAGNLTQFVTRTGDFCYMMNKSILEGKPISEENMEQLRQISQTCSEITIQLQDIQNNGGMDFDQMDSEAFFAEVGQDENDPVYKLNRDEEQYPKLIYDGPFSQSSEEQEPKGLEEKQVNASQALAVATEFLEEGAALEPSGELDGVIPAWLLSGTIKDGRGVTVAVTKTGQMFFMSTEEPGMGESISEEQAEQCAQIAQLYMQKRGFETQATYSQHYSGYVVVNLAAVQDDVILYPDLIKVWVDVQTGEITGFDFRNYLMEHRERDIPQAELSADEAKEYVSQTLEIQTEGRLSFIPKEDNSEVLCYEFSGMYGEKRFMVYINAQTGREEDVLLIIDTENGTLVE